MKKTELINEEIIRIQEIMGVNKKTIIQNTHTKARISEATSASGPTPLQFIEELFTSVLGAAEKGNLFNKLKGAVPELTSVADINDMLNIIRNNVDVVSKVEQEILSDPKFVDGLFNATCDYVEKKPWMKSYLNLIKTNANPSLISQSKNALLNVVDMSDEIWATLESKAMKELSENLPDLSSLWNRVGREGLEEGATSEIITEIVTNATSWKPFRKYIKRYGLEIDKIVKQMINEVMSDERIRTSLEQLEKKLLNSPADAEMLMRRAIDKLRKPLEGQVKGMGLLGWFDDLYRIKRKTPIGKVTEYWTKSAVVIAAANLATFGIEGLEGKHEGKSKEEILKLIKWTIYESFMGPLGAAIAIGELVYKGVSGGFDVVTSDKDIETIKKWAESEGGFDPGVKVTKNADNETYTVSGNEKTSKTALTMTVKLINGKPEVQL